MGLWYVPQTETKIILPIREINWVVCVCRGWGCGGVDWGRGGAGGGNLCWKLFLALKIWLNNRDWSDWTCTQAALALRRSHISWCQVFFEGFVPDRITQTMNGLFTLNPGCTRTQIMLRRKYPNKCFHLPLCQAEMTLCFVFSCNRIPKLCCFPAL